MWSWGRGRVGDYEGGIVGFGVGLAGRARGGVGGRSAASQPRGWLGVRI